MKSHQKNCPSSTEHENYMNRLDITTINTDDLFLTRASSRSNLQRINMRGLTECLAILTLLVSSCVISNGADTDSQLCSTIFRQLSPCIPYLTKSVVSPSKNCCDGAKSLEKYGRTKKDRQDFCMCVKARAQSLNGLDFSRANQLPDLCNLSVELPQMSLSFDCSK